MWGVLTGAEQRQNNQLTPKCIGNLAPKSPIWDLDSN